MSEFAGLRKHEKTQQCSSFFFCWAAPIITLIILSLFGGLHCDGERKTRKKNTLVFTDTDRRKNICVCTWVILQNCVPLEWFPCYECNQWHMAFNMWWTDMCTIDWSGIVNIIFNDNVWFEWINVDMPLPIVPTSITHVTWKPKCDIKFASFVTIL